MRAPCRRGAPAARFYPNRPASCRQWSCLWLLSESWSEELRPDRCGVVFDEIADVVTIDGAEQVCVQAWVARGCDDPWRTQPVLGAVLAMLANGVAVLFRRGPGRADVCVTRRRGRLYAVQTAAPADDAEPEAGRFRRAAELLARMPG